jgi:hypothetical protein
MAALNVKVQQTILQPGEKQKEQCNWLKLPWIMATAPSGSLNWEYTPIMVSKVTNQSITPRTGFRPVEIIFRKSPLADSFDRTLKVEHSLCFRPIHFVRQ